MTIITIPRRGAPLKQESEVVQAASLTRGFIWWRCIWEVSDELCEDGNVGHGLWETAHSRDEEISALLGVSNEVQVMEGCDVPDRCLTGRVFACWIPWR